MNIVEQVVTAIIGRGDVGHLGLLLWAACASAFALFMLRELTAANRRFDEFVRELNRFNTRQEGTTMTRRSDRKPSGGPAADGSRGPRASQARNAPAADVFGRFVGTLARLESAGRIVGGRERGR